MTQGKIWVVDDDSSIRWVLERALDNAKFACTCFDSADAVLAALENSLPDVLLSDIRMPGTNGIELLNTIKQSHPLLPIIIMTAHSDLDAAVNAYQSGAFDYLPKPFDIDETVALVERALNHSREQNHTSREAKQPAPTVSSTMIG
ncbi:response regulator, partial [Providencia sp. PROV112]